jgi:hypothetical protein
VPHGGVIEGDGLIRLERHTEERFAAAEWHELGFSPGDVVPGEDGQHSEVMTVAVWPLGYRHGVVARPGQYSALVDIDLPVMVGGESDLPGGRVDLRGRVDPQRLEFPRLAAYERVDGFRLQERPVRQQVKVPVVLAVHLAIPDPVLRKPPVALARTGIGI